MCVCVFQCLGTDKNIYIYGAPQDLLFSCVMCYSIYTYMVPPGTYIHIHSRLGVICRVGQLQPGIGGRSIFPGQTTAATMLPRGL